MIKNNTKNFSEPFIIFLNLFNKAKKFDKLYYNAFALATSDFNGNVSVRMLLLKGINPTGFIFFTNYNSLKGKQLFINPFGEILFFWKELKYQIRIHGKIEKLSNNLSDIYFNSRPRGSKISTWVSQQSNFINDRKHLLKIYQQYKVKFKYKKVPRPEYWGGYILIPESFEFWKERKNRLHERILFRFENNIWNKYYLAP